MTDIVRFAGAGGDFNPLHHDPAAATAAGFDGVIAMGQMTAGMLAGWVTDWCGVEHLRELEVRFVAPVRPGDVLELAGEVTDVRDEEAGEAVADLALTATVAAPRSCGRPPGPPRRRLRGAADLRLSRRRPAPAHPTSR